MFSGYLQTEINLRAKAYHRIVEAFKFGYSRREYLGDPDFNDAINKVRSINLSNVIFILIGCQKNN